MYKQEKTDFFDNDRDRYTYCNNCGKQNHSYVQCKVPITSNGIIAFRFNPVKEKFEYLMICRRNTLGYVDFLRGKYILNNKQYILNLIIQMTTEEKNLLKKYNFEDLWRMLWEKNPPDLTKMTEQRQTTEYKGRANTETTEKEEYTTKEKFYYLKNSFILQSIIKTSQQDEYEQWEDPEWGFPKGRRNYQEKDIETAIREFREETGVDTKYLKNIHNILPFEEIFIGSNYKCYKHKYYLMFIDYEDSLIPTVFQYEEVSKMEWKTYEECMKCIRSYNVEKKKVITNIHNSIQKYRIF